MESFAEKIKPSKCMFQKQLPRVALQKKLKKKLRLRSNI